MSVSHLEPRALARLRPSEIANLALSADQEARRRRKLGHHAEAEKWDRESERLATIFRESGEAPRPDAPVTGESGVWPLRGADGRTFAERKADERKGKPCQA